jgi:hypothetical protein
MPITTFFAREFNQRLGELHQTLIYVAEPFFGNLVGTPEQKSAKSKQKQRLKQTTVFRHVPA